MGSDDMRVDNDELTKLKMSSVHGDAHAGRPQLRAGGAACEGCEGSTRGEAIQVKNGMMVTRVKRAGGRRFAGRELRKARGVYNWRPVSSNVMQTLLLLVQCTSVLAEVPLLRKSSVQVRADLRARLARSLAAGEKERAFAKMCGFEDRPRADNPEAMMNAFPCKEGVEWDAPAARSGSSGS